MRNSTILMQHLHIIISLTLSLTMNAQAERKVLDFNQDWRFWQGAYNLDNTQTAPESLATWTFERGLEGWTEPQQCTRFTAADGILQIHFEANNPQFNSPPIGITGPVDLLIQLRCPGGGDLIVTWATPKQGYSPAQTASAPLKPTTAWQEVTLSLGSADTITRIRIEPPQRKGRMDIEQISLIPMQDPILVGKHLSTPSIDDSFWPQVRLPHDWAIAGPFDPNGNSQTGKLPWRNQGWYRKTFTLDPNDQGQRIYLDFDGVMAQPRIYINGHLAGSWDYGYNAFRVDITPWVHFNQPNTVTVHADTRRHTSHWYPGAGIYRKVRLVIAAPIHIAHWGSTITTPEITDQQARIQIATQINNHLTQDQMITLTAVIQDPNGRPLTHTQRNGLISPKVTTTWVQDLSIAHPQRWDIDHPTLYSVVCAIIHNGQIIDRISVPFGFREFQFTPDQGFILNGRHLPLRGVHLHHDNGPLGAITLRRALARKLDILKAMGCNAIRTSHNIPAPELLDLCDQRGLLVYYDLFDKWHGTADRVHGEPLLAFAHKQIRNAVQRDRNHPSIITWSIGNEVTYALGNQSGNAAQEVKTLANDVRLYDPTRPVTMACHMPQALQTHILDTLDIQSWNYDTKFTQAQTRYPDKPTLITASADTLSTRDHYSLPHPNNKTDYSATRQLTSYDLITTKQGDLPDRTFAIMKWHPESCGQFVNSGFDYLGNPTPYNRNRVAQGIIQPNQTARSSYTGILDLCGIPKDRYYLYRSQWLPDRTTLHILPHWTWPGQEGKPIPVYVYTNGDSAELFLNGQSLGRKHKITSIPPTDANDQDLMNHYRLRWENVPYQPGELKVIAYKQDKQIGEAIKRTAQQATTLRLSADRKNLRANGEDLAYILIGALDDHSTLNPTANHKITFTITGPATLAATANGNPLDHTSFTSNQRTLFHGKAMLILRTTNTPGDITVQAHTNGLRPAEVVLKSQ